MTGRDYERLGKGAEQLVRFSGNRAFMRMVEGHCAALQYRQPLASQLAGHWVCSTYDSRPAICRELARGSAQCRGELEAKKNRPIALRRRAAGF